MTEKTVQRTVVTIAKRGEHACLFIIRGFCCPEGLIMLTLAGYVLIAFLKGVTS